MRRRRLAEAGFGAFSALDEDAAAALIRILGQIRTSPGKDRASAV